MIRTCQNLEKHQFNMAWIIRKNCLFFSCVCVDSPLLPSPYPVPPLMRIQYAICRYTLAAGLTLPSPQPSPPQTDCLLPATPHHFRARRVPLLHNMNEIENEWTIFFSFLLYYYIHLDMTWEITVYLQRTYVRCAWVGGAFVHWWMLTAVYSLLPLSTHTNRERRNCCQTSAECNGTAWQSFLRFSPNNHDKKTVCINPPRSTRSNHFSPCSAYFVNERIRFRNSNIYWQIVNVSQS